MGDFVCTTPNQTRIFLPSFQKSEVKLRADIRYGPDDPMLWPQPWVDLYCHLGAIPRKPDDPNDRLSIMWWDPTLDDFKSSGGSLVDGLGELSGSKLLSLQSRMSNMEDRIEDHKRAFPNTNSLLLLLARAMQDAFARLHSLKTTLTEMRVGVAEFQRYYLELYGCLDYLEIYKPRMEGLKPPAESVANCMGTITNVPSTVQDFYTAGLPVWFLRPSTVWDSPVRCNILETVTPLDPGDVLCVSEHYPPFPAIFYGSATDPKRHGACYAHSRKWLVFKDPFGDLTSQSIQFCLTYLLTTFKGTMSSTVPASSGKSALPSQSTSSSPPASSSQSASAIQSAGRGKTFRPEHSRPSTRAARAAPCTFTPSFLGRFPNVLFLRRKAPN
jgi:hypothetical protein